MQNTNHNTNVTGAGCSDNPDPAVGSLWNASQWSNRSNYNTTSGNAQLNTETGLNEGDKTITDLITIEPWVAVITGSLDKLFKEIHLAVVRCKYLAPIRYRSSASRDSDDDSSDSDEDECRHRSPEVCLPEKPNADIVAVNTRYYFRGVRDYPGEHKTDRNSNPRSASRLWSAFDERMNRSFSSESQSELLWSLDLEQPWPSDRELSSDSQSNSTSEPSPKLKSASHSELNWSIDDEKLWPSNIMHAWWPSDSELWTASQSELKWSTDDEELLPTNVMQMYPSDSELQSSSLSGVRSTGDEELLPTNVMQTRPSNSKLFSASHSELKCATDDEQLLPSNSKQTRPSKLEICSVSNLELKCATDDKQLQLSTVKQTWLTDSALRVELHSELMWSTSKEQLGKADLNQIWLSDSDLRTASYSDLIGSTRSMKKDELEPSDLQKWPTISELRSASLSEPLMSLSDDEQIFSFDEEQIFSFYEEKILSFDEEQILSFDEEQNMVSLHDEKEINVVSINEASDVATVVELSTPKRRSLLSALGRRVLSVGRKLFLCGCCGCNRKR